MAEIEVVALRNEDTNNLFKLDTYTPGTYTKKIIMDSQSILSTVFVKAIDLGASVKVNYWQDTSGTIEEDLERFDLPSHPLQSAPNPMGNQILVPRIHNKPRIEVVVTGGSVTFGVYASARNETASDIDSALQLDASDVDLLSDKGIPTMCYDQAQNKFFFLRCENGTIPVSFSEAGTPFYEGNQTVSTPGVEQTILDFTVAASKIRRLNQAIVTSGTTHGLFRIQRGSDIIGSGRIGSGNLNNTFPWLPRFEAAAGQRIRLFYLQPTGKARDIEAYIQGNEIDA